MALALVSAVDPVVGGDGDHAVVGEVAALLFELARVAAVPASAKEEDDGGAGGCLGFWALGEDVEVEFGVADGFVGFGSCAFQDWGDRVLADCWGWVIRIVAKVMGASEKTERKLGFISSL